jgi:hypothetical protein
MRVGLRNAKPGPVRRRARRGRGGAVFQGENGNGKRLAERSGEWPVWRRLVEPSEFSISQ